MTKCNNFDIRQNFVSKNNIKEEQKTQRVKSMPMHRKSIVSIWKGEKCYIKKRNYIKYYKKWNKQKLRNQQHIDMRTKHFCITFQMKNIKEISNIQKFQTKVWNQYTLKKDNPEIFSFQDLSEWYFLRRSNPCCNNCELIQSQKCDCQSVQAVHSY